MVPLLVCAEAGEADEVFLLIDSQGRAPKLDGLGSLLGVESWELLDLMSRRATCTDAQMLVFL